MSIGAGIALVVIGAVLTFAVNVEVAWVNLDLIGYILMGAGALVFLMGSVLTIRRRRIETVRRSEIDPVTNEHVSRDSTSSTNDIP